MSESNIIHLSTESGLWHYDAQASDDPYFGEYLSSIAEVGPLPSNVIFRGSVAEVLEEEWDSAVDLINYLFRSSMSGYIGFDPVFSHLVPLTDVWKNRDRNDVFIPSGVELGDVARISRIITLPTSWRLAVPIGGNVSDQEKVDHLLSMAQILPDLYTLKQDPKWYEMSSVVWQVKECVEENEETAGILWASLRDAALSVLTTEVKRDTLLPRDVKWNLVINALSRMELEDTLAFRTAMTFAGRGDPSKHASRLLYDIQVDGTVNPIFIDPSSTHIHALYHSVLDSLPNDISIFIPQGKEDVPREPNAISNELVVNDVMKVVPWIHRVIAFTLTGDANEEYELLESDYDAYIHLLDQFIVGRDGLLKIEKIVSGYFSERLRLYLSRNEPRRVINRFPLSAEVTRAMRYGRSVANV